MKWLEKFIIVGFSLFILGGLAYSAAPQLVAIMLGNTAVSSSNPLPVSVVGGGGGGLSVTDQAAFTQGTSNFTPGGGVFNDTATLSSGQQGTFRMTTKRAQIVDTDTTGNALYSALTSGVGTPGSAVPSTGIYIGGNVSGNFRGWTGVNPSGSVYSQQMDLASVNGVTASTGTGAVGTGTPRVAVGTDTATVAGTAPATAGIAATGAAPPAGSIQVAAVASGATGGLMAGLKTCDQHAKYDASDTGSITLVTGVASRKIYICGYILATGGTATNLKLREGSDANCATNGADLTPAYQLVANDKIGMQAAFWTGLAVSTNAYYVCVNASAANAHQAEIWYTIQ